MAVAYMSGWDYDVISGGSLYVNFQHYGSNDNIRVEDGNHALILEDGTYLIRIYAGTTTYINSVKGDTSGIVVTSKYHIAGISQITTRDNESFNLYPYITVIKKLSSGNTVRCPVLIIMLGLFNRKSLHPSNKAYMTVMRID